MKTLILTLILATCSFQTYAISGNEALKLMTGSEEKEFRMVIYAIALRDAEAVVVMNTKSAIVHNEEYIDTYCIPNQVTNGQLASVILNRLRTKPEDNHLPLSVIARLILTQSYPCTQNEMLKGFDPTK